MMNPTLGMAGVFLALSGLCVVAAMLTAPVGWSPRRDFISDTLMWAAVPLSVLAVVAGLLGLMMEAVA